MDHPEGSSAIPYSNSDAFRFNLTACLAVAVKNSYRTSMSATRLPIPWNLLFTAFSCNAPDREVDGGENTWDGKHTEWSGVPDTLAHI
jgi:hypothetical protein